MKYISFIVAIFIFASCEKNVSKPEIVIEGENPKVIYLNEVYSDAGASATDKEDGPVSNRISVSGNVNSALAGVYSVNYQASDKRKLLSDVYTRTVIVKIAAQNLLGYYSLTNTVNGVNMPGVLPFDAVNISAGDDETIYLNNFAGLDSVKVKLIISGDNGTKVTLPEQTVVHETNTYVLKGDGADGVISADGKKIEVGYIKTSITATEAGKMMYTRVQ